MESTTTDSVLEYKLEPEDSAVYKVLNNELLLDRIFEIEKMNEPLVDLRIFRLVCKKWKRRATVCLRGKYWKNRNFLVLKDIEELKKYTHTLAPFIPSEPESEFLHYGRLAIKSDPISLEESQLFQCYKINFRPDCVRSGNVKLNVNTEIPMIFFSVFPHSVKSLKMTMSINTGLLDKILTSQSSSLSELRLHVVVHDEDIRTFLAQKEEAKMKTISTYQDVLEQIKLVNLDYLFLKIRMCSCKGSNIVSQYGHAVLSKFTNNLLENLLKKIPEGRSIRICLLNWKYIKGMMHLFKQYDQLKNLEVLMMRNTGEVVELASLAECGVQLQSLAVQTHEEPHMVFTNGHPQSVYDFLGSQLNCLQQLSWASVRKFKFPGNPMVALKKLKLTCLTATFPNVAESPAEIIWNQNCRPICYDSFPKLEELSIDVLYTLSVDQFYSWFLSPQLPCNSVKKFEIDYFWGFCTGILTAISNTFTHLKLLKLGGFSLETKIAEEDYFHTLWNARFAPTLEDLSIKLTNCKEQRESEEMWEKYGLDNLFSGVSEEIIKNVSESGDYSSFTSSNNSILNFKNLRTLEIIDYHDVVNKKGIFTDFSAYCVFGKLDRLGCLLLAEGMWEFSKDASAYLQKKLRDASTYPIPNLQSNRERMERFFCRGSLVTLTRRIRDSDEITVSFRDLDLDKDKGNGN